MLRIYLRLALLLVIAFTLLFMAMRALGSSQPLHTALRGFAEGCEGVPQPCWYGIGVGSTTRTQAQQILIAHGYRWLNQTRYGDFTREWFEGDCNVTLFTRQDETVHGLQLSFCGRLYIGDVLEMTDPPTYVLPIDSANALLKIGEHVALHVPNWLSPRQPVLSITLGREFVADWTLNWRGFAANWVYCLSGWASTDCFRM
jgi:hypothetical protein